MNDLPHWPAPKLRMALFLCVMAAMLYSLVAGGNPFALLAAPAVALIAPEIVEFFPWLMRRGREHVYEPGENDRMYTYGLVNIWMRMQGEIPWFVARDVANALRVEEIELRVEKFATSEKCVMEADGELCLSEKGVLRLASGTRTHDSPKFRLWFEREVMFPIRRKRELQRP